MTAAPEAARRRRRGLLAVALGLGVFGGANFAFLALAGRDLGPAVTAPLSIVWTLLNAVGIGLFMPLEQETGRRLSAAAARGGRGADLGRTIAFAALAVSGLLLTAAIFAEGVGDWLLLGRGDLAVVLALGLAGQALVYFARGVLAGTGRFERYGAQLALDGALRVGGSALLFASDQGTSLLYGVLLVVAPVVATLVTASPAELVRRARARDHDGRGAGAPDGAMSMLVVSSLSGQLLANAGPIAITALVGTQDAALSGRFVAAVTVARIPLFLFAAVQAVFLPALAGLVARHQLEQFGAAVRRALLATGVLATAGVVGVAVAGVWALRVVYGPGFALSAFDMTLVALSGGLYMIAQVLVQALLAHHADHLVTAGWLTGLLVLLLTLVVGLDPATRVATALCTGSCAAALVHAVGLRLVVRRAHAADLVRASRPA